MLRAAEPAACHLGTFLTNQISEGIHSPAVRAQEITPRSGICGALSRCLRPPARLYIRQRALEYVLRKVEAEAAASSSSSIWGYRLRMHASFAPGRGFPQTGTCLFPLGARLAMPSAPVACRDILMRTRRGRTERRVSPTNNMIGNFLVDCAGSGRGYRARGDERTPLC